MKRLLTTSIILLLLLTGAKAQVPVRVFTPDGSVNRSGITRLRFPNGTISATGNLMTFNVIPTAVLEGGVASPGDSKYYGTNSSGTKGFFDLPAGGGGTVTDYLWMAAAGCDDVIASSLWDLPTSNKPTPICVTGSNIQKGVLEFPDLDGDYTAQQTLDLHPNWTGAVDVRWKWAAAATSGNVVWQLQTTCTADGEADDPSWNTVQTVTDTAKATTLQVNEAVITSITMTGCSAGELFHLRVLRNRTHASDTITGTVRLLGLGLTIRHN